MELFLNVHTIFHIVERIKRMDLKDTGKLYYQDNNQINNDQDHAKNEIYKNALDSILYSYENNIVFLIKVTFGLHIICFIIQSTFIWLTEWKEII